jgi:hypothetical protein
MSTFVYPFILGLLTKVYDDTIDIGFHLPDYVVSTLQTLIVFFFTLTAYGDFYFSFSCLIVSGVNGGFDHPFWKSFFPLCAVLTVLHLPYAGGRMLLKMALSLLGLAFILFGAYVEELLFPEEVSKTKIVVRVWMMIGFGIGAMLLSWNILPLPSYSVVPLYKTSVLLLAHMMVSVAIMTYLYATESPVVQFTGGAEKKEEAREGNVLHSLCRLLRKNMDACLPLLGI